MEALFPALVRFCGAVFLMGMGAVVTGLVHAEATDRPLDRDTLTSLPVLGLVIITGLISALRKPRIPR